MNPATLFTIMVTIVVGMVMVTAWTLDRLAASQAREEVLRAELETLRPGRPLKQLDWMA